MLYQKLLLNIGLIYALIPGILRDAGQFCSSDPQVTPQWLPRGDRMSLTLVVCFTAGRKWIPATRFTMWENVGIGRRKVGGC